VVVGRSGQQRRSTKFVAVSKVSHLEKMHRVEPAESGSRRSRFLDRIRPPSSRGLGRQAFRLETLVQIGQGVFGQGVFGQGVFGQWDCSLALVTPLRLSSTVDLSAANAPIFANAVR
jgi:hypothetical protein